MPFVSDYTPISSVLALSGIAGAGRGIAEQKARRLQEEAQAAQIAQQNIANQMQVEQQQRHEQAVSQANAIQTALAYDQLRQRGESEANQLARRKTEAEAHRMQEQTQAAQYGSNRAEQVRQFEERQKQDKATSEAVQKRFDAGLAERQSRAQAIEDHFKAAANRAETVDRRRHIAELRKSYMDYENKLTGRDALLLPDAEVANIKQRQAAIEQEIAGQTPTASPTAPPATQPVQPQQSQGIPIPGTDMTVSKTGQATPQGIPLVHVASPTLGESTLPLLSTQEEFDSVPAGTQYIDANGHIGVKGR